MTSVVIAAHDEAAVLGRCLDALLSGPGHPDVTVVANGCTDGTAAVARAQAGVRVLELAEAGKAAALNAGDAVAVGFPRVYLDADIVLPPGAVDALAGALAGTGALAAVPARALDLTGRPPLVRAFYAINTRLPAYRGALFGRGAVALSGAGRARFDAFPGHLDSLFAPEEKTEVPAVVSTVAAPRRTADLVRRLVRVRAANAQLRTTSTAVRRSVRSSWLRDVVVPRPWLAPAGACYAALVLTAELRARREARGTVAWGRDESSRRSHA